MDAKYIPWTSFIFFLSCGSAFGCQRGWSLYNGMCYQVSHLTYDVRMARRYCQVSTGDLAYVNNSETLQFLNTLQHFDGQRTYWLREDSFLPTNVSSTNESSTQAETSECPYAKILGISYAGCDETKYFICQVPELTSEMDCPMGFDLFGSLCFRAVPIQLNLESAIKNCALQHSQLAILDSVEKEHAAQSLVIGQNITYLVAAKREGEDVKWFNEKKFEPSCREAYPTCRVETPGDCIGLISGEHPMMFSWINVDCSSSFNFLCETTATLKSTTPTTPEPTTTEPPLVCPHGYNWKSHEESGYCFWETTYETDRLSWYNAREFCRRFGGDLASYRSQSEERSGLGGAVGHYRGLWFGLKRDKNNIFRWVDGTEVNYTNWDFQEPKLHSRYKFCVVHGPNESKWQLDSCGVRRWFVCKAPKVRIPTMPDTDIIKKEFCNISGSSAYRSQWRLYENYCYLVHETGMYSWDTAQLFCNDNGAHLASVHSFNESDFILSVASLSPSTDFWIGLNARGLLSSYEWSDGSPLDFLYWNEESEENSGEEINSCVTFNKRDGSWKKDSCNHFYQGVICKRPVSGSYEFTTTEPTPNLQGNCENGWYTLGNKCYKHFGKKWSRRLTWPEASQSCKEMEATLVSIHNQDEQDFLLDLILEASTSVWIGMRTHERRKGFQWSDDSRIDYTNWDIDEPQLSIDPEEDMEDGIQAESCVEMIYDRTLGVWQTTDCLRRKKAYICQKPKDPNILEPPENPFLCGNITGWYKLGSACYGIFEEQQATWMDAQAHCRTFDANLVTYSTYLDFKFLSRKIQKSGYFWAGVREESEEKYSAVNGRGLRYTPWMAGQPHRAAETMSNCVAVTTNGDWIVKDCKEKHFYICEWNPEEYKEPYATLPAYTCSNVSSLYEDLGGEYCYLFRTDYVTSWVDAMHYCFRHGGALASFHSKKEIDAVRSFIINVESVTPVLHIGLGKRKDGGYAWADNSPVDFISWEEGEPNNPDTHCTAMHVSTGEWRDVDCEETRRGFICSAPKQRSIGNESMPIISASEKESVSTKLAVGGIFGIVICFLVVIAIIAVSFYYICRPQRTLQPALMEQESL